jgi:opacity protein-like surface antigen
VLFGLGFAEGVGAAVALLVVVGGVEQDVLSVQAEVLAGADLRAFGRQGAAGREADVVSGQGGDFSRAARFLAAAGDGGFTGTEETLVFTGAGAGFVQCWTRIGFCLFLAVDRNSLELAGAMALGALRPSALTAAGGCFMG